MNVKLCAQSVKLRNGEGSAGFSLVELLVVIAILAVLAAIAIPLFLNQRAKAAQAVVQSDARNVATDLTSLFTNLPTTSNATVSLNSDASTNIAVSGSVVVGVAGETATITLSPNVTLTKTGNTNPALGSGLKFNNTSNPTYACVISLPATVPYSWAVKLQPQCGTIVSEEGNLVPMNMATGTDTSNNASGIGAYVANSPGGVYSSTDRAYKGTHSIKVVHQSTRTDALVTGFQTLPASCCPVPPSIAIPSGGWEIHTRNCCFHPRWGEVVGSFCSVL